MTQSSQKDAPEIHRNATFGGGKIRGFRGQIIWAMFLMFLPAVLMAILMAFIFQNHDYRDPSIDNSDRVEVDGVDQAPETNQYLYISYSATRLAFISSLAATLSLALVPVALPMLWAYISASRLLKLSSTSRDGLPSPYQFELLLRIIEGGTLEIIHYVKYLFRSKRRRTAVAPIVNHAAWMLSIMLLLAIGVTVVDALFHIRTITVTYRRSEEIRADDFQSGRRLPAYCLDEAQPGEIFGCNVVAPGSGAAIAFTNSSQGYLTAGNQSATNFVQLADDGKTAIIVPTDRPPQKSFTAQSFASATVCETRTRSCNPHSNRQCSANACRSWAYECTPEASGLLWNGNYTFSDTVVNFNFFNNSEMTTNGSTSSRGASDGQLWFAIEFFLNRDDSDRSTYVDLDGEEMTYSEQMDLVRISDGIRFGIMSCITSLSDAVYTRKVDGSITNLLTTPLNNTASVPFVQPITTVNAAASIFDNGITLVNANAVDKAQLAYQFARLFDRTLLSLTSGLLENEAAQSVVQQSSQQVARVPIAELGALVALNLVYPLLGLVLGIWALILCRRDGVRDVQARLALGAMVAGNFEDPKFNATATHVHELYAEARGLETKRVAVSEWTGGSKVLVGVHSR